VHYGRIIGLSRAELVAHLTAGEQTRRGTRTQIGYDMTG
jgi:hypothetical protein